MLRIIIVLVIVIIIWMLNPLTNSFNFTPQTKLDKKTKNEINQVVNQAQQQANNASNIQYQEKTSLDNEQ